MMENIIVIVIVSVIIIGIIIYLVRAKKRGETCIGCPYAKQCGDITGGSCKKNCDHDHTDSSGH